MLIAGTSSSNLYALLVKDGWGLGAPEGICHWNGSHWRWVHKISGKNDFVIDMQLVFDQLRLTTAAGDILRMSFDGSVLDHAVPSLSALLCKDMDLCDVSFSSSAFPSKDSAVVVGTKGSLYYYDGSRWNRVQTNTTNQLYEAVGKLPVIYILGNGLIGLFDGHKYRQVLESKDTYYLHGQCTGLNELVLGAKSPAGPQLIHLFLDSHRSKAISMPSGVVSVWGESFDDLYIGTSWSGVLRKIGNNLRVSLDASYPSGLLFRIGDELVTGGILQDAPCVFILRGEQWDPLPIELDMSYLEPDPPKHTRS